MPAHRPTPPLAGQPSRDLYIRRIAYGYALINVGSGATYLLGGPATSPSLNVVQAAAPIQVWGAALLLAGVLALASRYVPAYLLGMTAWSAFAVSSWWSFFAGTLTGGSGPWVTTGLVYLHVIALRWRNQDRLAHR